MNSRRAVRALGPEEAYFSLKSPVWSDIAFPSANLKVKIVLAISLRDGPVAGCLLMLLGSAAQVR